MLDQSAFDATFTAADLEGLLRPYDIDHLNLSVRLTDLVASTISNDPTAGNRFTTHSFSVPAPAVQLTAELRRALHESNATPTAQDRAQRPPNLLDYARFISAMDLTPQQLQEMLPLEILKGEKMDLNRPFSTDGKIVFGNSDLMLNDNGEVLAPSGTPVNGAGALEAKQMYARHLYCLAVMLMHPDAQLSDDENPASDPQKTRQLWRSGRSTSLTFVITIRS